MKRWIRRVLIGLLVLFVLLAAAVAVAVNRSDAKRDRVMQQPGYALVLREDAASIERGRYLFNSRGCTDCHGNNGAGRVFVNDERMGMRLAGPNITPGPGNVVGRYRAEDWERVLRHGIKPDGRPVMVMPSEDYTRYTDADIAALAAYVRQLPPAEGGPATLQLPLPVRVLYALGVVQDAAEKIDHRLAPAQPVAEGATVEHGRYVAQSCLGCHGPQLSGGKIPGGPPDWPAAANLTPGEGSVMPRYADAAAFKALLRSGHRPDGSAVRVMPFESLGRISDLDVDALYLYLKSLPARAAGGR